MTSRIEKNKKLKKEKIKAYKKEKKAKRRKTLLKISLIIIIILALITLYAKFIEPNLLLVNENKIKNEKIPENFNGLKIVHFSDLHYGNTINKNNINKVIDKINNLKPDIVIFTGDLIDKEYKATKDDITTLTKALKEIDYKYGKYSIIGNHDYYNEDYDNIMYDSNFMLLKNTYDTVYNDNQNPLLIYGFDDVTYGNPTTEGLKDKNLKDVKYKIALIHEGDYIDKFINDYDIDLILSGHSHNGQIKIPYVKPPILPEYSKKYYDNYYKINNTDIYISNGIGTSIIKFRLASIPSINFYRLEKK